MCKTKYAAWCVCIVFPGISKSGRRVHMANCVTRTPPPLSPSPLCTSNTIIFSSNEIYCVRHAPHTFSQLLKKNNFLLNANNHIQYIVDMDVKNWLYIDLIYRKIYCLYV